MESGYHRLTSPGKTFVVSLSILVAVILSEAVNAQPCKGVYLRSTGPAQPTDYALSKSGEFCDGLVYVPNASGDIGLVGLQSGEIDFSGHITSTYFTSNESNSASGNPTTGARAVTVVGRSVAPGSTYRADGILTRKKPALNYGHHEKLKTLALTSQDIAFVGWVESSDWGRLYIPIASSKKSTEDPLRVGVHIPSYAAQINYTIINPLKNEEVIADQIRGEFASDSVVWLTLETAHQGVTELNIEVTYYDSALTYETSFYLFL